MKNRKINVDRPPVDSKEIQSHMDFNQVLAGHNIMTKPFYKSAWFFGTTGLASLGLIIGGSMMLYDDNTEELAQTTDAPPDLIEKDPVIIHPTANLNYLNHQLAKETIKNIQPKITTDETAYDKTNTLANSQSNENKTSEKSEIAEPTELADNSLGVPSTEDKSETFNFMDLMPRIGGKLDGKITREELFDNKGITTESDVSIIHFELHLIDGLGGQVFEEEGNQLSEEMKEAIDKIEQGETIYFENIKGKAVDGTVVRLNPMRYVLMN